LETIQDKAIGTMEDEQELVRNFVRNDFE